jgi:Putative restriction endonuclease
VFCGELTYGPDQTATNPVVVIEVLSDSTRTYDRGEKVERYKIKVNGAPTVVLGQPPRQLVRYCPLGRPRRGRLALYGGKGRPDPVTRGPASGRRGFVAGSARVGTAIGWSTGLVWVGLRPATAGGIERTMLERTVGTAVMDSSAENATAGWTNGPDGHRSTSGSDRRAGVVQAEPR